jgi:predicted RecA/RadA family phage recombinase
MVGEGSGIAPDRGLNILNRVTMNTLMNLTAAGLTRDNYSANAQSLANTRLSADSPKGILAGQLVTVGTVSGTVVACTGTNAGTTVLVGRPVGVAINNAVGYPFESSSGVASGKAPYLHGTGTVFSTDMYETVRQDGTTPIVFAPGALLYVSQNGLFSTVADSLAIIVGIVLIAPSATDPFMVVQLSI